MTSKSLPLGQWLERLTSFSPHEIDLGLDRVKAVLDRLTLPRPDLVVHVAGTNGKGSSVALAEALLCGSAHTVGAYTSPHVRRFNERIAIDGVPAGDAEIVAAFERVDTVRAGLALTYFEFSTLAALVIFAERGVNRAVLEIGLGGRLDAVNAIDPDAGLITNISLDHCDWLGDSVEAIGREKAGIMRPGRPTVFAAREVPGSIVEAATDTGADLILAGRDYDWTTGPDTWNFRGRRIRLDGLCPPSMRGDFQYTNAAGVLALLEAAGIDDSLDVENINTALGSVGLEGRMQRIDRQREWLLDVAHNPASAQVLARALAEDGSGGRTVAIVGMRDDKDVEGLVGALSASVDAWIGVPVEDARSLDVTELARRVANASGRGCLETADVREAIAAARMLSQAGDRIVVTGSFYIVGPALEALGL